MRATHLCFDDRDRHQEKEYHHEEHQGHEEKVREKEAISKTKDSDAPLFCFVFFVVKKAFLTYDSQQPLSEGLGVSC
jgi:hypothetical protein